MAQSPEDIDDITAKISSVKLSPTNKLEPAHESTKRPPQPKSSSIFINKKFSSLAAPSRKPIPTKNKPSTPTKKVFDQNAFFSDTPMAVDDKRWGHKIDLYRSTDKPGNVIINPMKESENLDHRADVKFVSGFSKYSKQDSPFKDPYSALNNSSIKRSGEAFLDSGASQYNKEAKLAESLLNSISENDDKRELEKLEEEEITEKDRKVKGLSVNLLDHQVHGLKFLRKREKSKLTNKGGLLCDDMGLGKTVQAIALIVKNTADEKDLKSSAEYKQFKTTLVICPVSLTTQWNQEIKRFAPHLKTLVFHGTKRTRDYRDLIENDVVISSYDTIRSEHVSPDSSPIYKGSWHRVILDEAHVIKNSKAKVSIAVCAIKSPRRWCLTGTPVQNSVDELQSLFMFLGVSKLSSPSVWKKTISAEISGRHASRAFDVLKEELDQIMLRRTKAILKHTSFTLPEKRIHRTEISFSAQEQKLYDDLKARFVSKLTHEFQDEIKDKGVADKDSPSVDSADLINKISPSKVGAKDTRAGTTFYMCALVYLLRLRQVCCHWKLLSISGAVEVRDLNVSPSKKNKQLTASPSKTDINVDKEVDDLADFMTELSVKETKCEVCFNEKVAEGQHICKTCDKKMASIRKSESAKVLKLVEILNKDKKRKTIVFSQFREVLVLLGPVLETMGFGYVIYDGTMNVKQKDQALEKLRTDSDTTVLLCSLKSGAVGLNLTVASQVVIFDPWWNPQIEEQAIDRVYRIGQTRDVDVHKFAVKGSVEIGIVELQEKKRALASAITGTRKEAQESIKNLSQNELIKLFGLNKV